MGFWSKLFGRKSKSTKSSTATSRATGTSAASTAAAAPAPSRPSANTNGAASNGAKDQCAAITAAGTQCTMGARDNSKYCGRHKGYRPPAGTVAAKAKDTKPRAKGGKDTAPSARRSHVTHNGYKLYQKGNRYFFSKKSQAEAKADGATPVYEMPADRTVAETANGLPVLKKA